MMRKTSGMVRDTLIDARAAWVVQDGNYLSARYYLDAYRFGAEFVAMLSERAAAPTTTPAP